MFFLGPYLLYEQSRWAVQFRGARRWAGLQSKQEHAGSGGLQSRSGQEEGEAERGEWRLPPGWGHLVGGGEEEDEPIQEPKSQIAKRLKHKWQHFSEEKKIDFLK